MDTLNYRYQIKESKNYGSLKYHIAEDKYGDKKIEVFELPLPDSRDWTVTDQFRDKSEQLISIEHKNIVKYEESFYEDHFDDDNKERTYYITRDFKELSPLKNEISLFKNSPDRLKKFIVDIVDAIEYLNKESIHLTSHLTIDKISLTLDQKPIINDMVEPIFLTPKKIDIPQNLTESQKDLYCAGLIFQTLISQVDYEEIIKGDIKKFQKKDHPLQHIVDRLLFDQNRFNNPSEMLDLLVHVETDKPNLQNTQNLTTDMVAESINLAKKERKIEQIEQLPDIDMGDSDQIKLLTEKKMVKVDNIKIKEKQIQQNKGDDVGFEEIVKYILDRIKKQFNKDLSTDQVALKRIKEIAPKYYKELEQNGEVEINLPFISANVSGPIHANFRIYFADIKSLKTDLPQHDIFCPRCGSKVEKDKINRNFQLTTCPKCATVFNYETSFYSGEVSGTQFEQERDISIGAKLELDIKKVDKVNEIKNRDKIEKRKRVVENMLQNSYKNVPMPDHISMTKNGETELKLEYGWFNFRSLGMLIAGLVFGLTPILNDDLSRTGNEPFLFMFPLALIFLYIGLAGIINVTFLTVTKRNLKIEHKPFPWFTGGEFSSKDINQLYTLQKEHKTKNGRYYTYQLRMIDKNFKHRKLLTTNKPEQAIFLEFQIEKFLNIEDYRVSDEYRY